MLNDFQQSAGKLTKISKECKEFKIRYQVKVYWFMSRLSIVNEIKNWLKCEYMSVGITQAQTL